MNRLFLLVLITGSGFLLPIQADPLGPATTGIPDTTSKKVNGKVSQNPSLLPNSSKIKSYKRNKNGKGFAGRVGDFGPLPTNSYKRKNHNEGDAPPHPQDFGTVPIESGPDTRKAK